jgi:urease accessory protein
VISRSRAVVGAGGVLEVLDCDAPLTLRRVYSEGAATCALCLVGTAAGPLAGDDLELSLHLLPGARASLVATGASIAQGRDPQSSARLVLRAQLDAGARLHADPGPLIVCAGSRVDVRVELALAGDASIEWRELVVLGRSGDRPGSASLNWDVTVDGRPLLRHHLDLTDPSLLAWPGMLGDARVLATALLAGPWLQARTVVSTPAAVAQRLDDRSALLSVLGRDAADATRELDELCARVRGERDHALHGAALHGAALHGAALHGAK